MINSIDEMEYVDEQKKSGDPSKSSLHRKNRDKNLQSTMNDKTKPLAKYSVLYLGAGIPSPNQRGIDSIQEPLSRRYPVDGKETVYGIETSISINTDGFQIQFVSDPSVILYYPIRSLSYCAGVRFARQSQTIDEFSNGWRFVSLDSPEASQAENTQNPPVFAVTFRRTRFSPVDECHCFVAKNKHTALNLVEACYKAYHISNSQQDCSKVPLYFKVDANGVKTKELNNEIYIVPAVEQERTLDYQISQESSGFFYKTDQVQIDCWQLWEHQKNGTHRTSSTYSASSRSSRSSHRHAHQSQHISTMAAPDSPKSYRSQFETKNHSTEQLTQPKMDPYIPAPDVFRVERIKDKETGRDVFVRWLHDKPNIPKEIPSTQTSNNDNQAEKILLKETKRLALNSEQSKKSVVFKDNLESTATYHEHKKSKKKHKKHKHRDSQIIEFYENHPSKTRKSPRHHYNDIYKTSSSIFTEQQFSSPIFMERQPSIPFFIEQQQQQQQSSPIFMNKSFILPSSSVTYPMTPVPYTFQTIDPYGPTNMNMSSGYWYFTI